MNDDTEKQQNSDARIDGRARRAARKIGLKASKTRRRSNSPRGFKITNPHLDTIVAEDMSAEQVIEYCRRVVETRGS